MNSQRFFNLFYVWKKHTYPQSLQFSLTKMSSSKTTKADFIAIYRLEFYKNKRNWRLGSKESKLEPKIQNILNKTYDVEDGSASHLNDAFIDTGSDTDRTSKSKLESPRKCNLTQQWLESINIWPSGVHKPKPSQSNDILQKLLSRNNPDVLRETDFEKDKPGYSRSPSCPGLEQEINAKVPKLEREFLPERDEMHPRTINTMTTASALTKEDVKKMEELQQLQYNYPMDQGMTWPEYYPAFPPPLHPGGNHPDLPRDRWVHEEPGAEEVDVVDGAEHNLLSSTGFLYLQQEFNLVEERMSSRSVDSFSEFSRGADLAPHASDLEISDSKSEELDANLVARMSTVQLSTAIRAHAQRLAQLLWESGERRKLRRPHSLYERMSVEEFPTHDIDTCSDFIAGSFRAPVPPGRAGGRVVIEGGRPVRLQGDFV